MSFYKLMHKVSLTMTLARPSIHPHPTLCLTRGHGGSFCLLYLICTESRHFILIKFNFSSIPHFHILTWSRDGTRLPRKVLKEIKYNIS